MSWSQNGGTPIKVDSSGSPAGAVTVQDASDVSRLLQVNASGQAAVQNPPNLDVATSTRATEATLATRAAAATQTDGTQRTQVRGGAKGATVAADLTSTAEGADHQALDVQVYTGGVAIDPRSVRALTASDVVTAQQGTNPWTVGFQHQALDAFGRQRVSNALTIFDSKQVSDNQPLFWDDQQISGAGTSSTYNTNQASTTIAVSNVTAGVRVRQTFRPMNYQPGKSQLIFMTWVSTVRAAGIVKRVGQFNTNNGVFFEQNGTTLNFVRRTFTSGSAVDNAVAQASWNIDRLDGTGASGITLDETRAQILAIDYEWLGVGSIRFGFVINGAIIYAHQMNHANSLSLVWASSPNLPLRYEIQNTGAGGVASLTHICTTVITEGGRDLNQIGVNFSIDRGSTALQTLNNSSLYPILAMRLRSGYQHAQVVPNYVSILSSTNAAIQWQLLLNPTVTGTALSFSTVTNSAVEADVARTNATTVSGGTVLAGGYVNIALDAAVRLENDLTLGVSIAGVSDILVLAARKITGTTESIFATLTWHEAQ